MGVLFLFFWEDGMYAVEGGDLDNSGGKRAGWSCEKYDSVIAGLRCSPMHVSPEVSSLYSMGLQPQSWIQPTFSHRCAQFPSF